MSLGPYELGRVHEADAVAGLLALPAASVQCIVTSPPYWGLRNYGVEGQWGLEATPEEYVAHMVELGRAVWHALREDGTFWLNLGDCYIGGGRGEGAENCKQRTNVGSLDAVPNVRAPGFKSKDLVGIPWRVALALQADGWYLRRDIIWAKPNPMPESVEDRCTSAHEYIFHLAKSERYYYDAAAIKEKIAESTVARVALAEARTEVAAKNKADLTEDRYKRCQSARVSADTYADGRDHLVCKPKGSGRNCRSVWTMPTAPYPGAHYAVFPPSLPERCIRAGTRPGDIVCDPFAGSGTTGEAAHLLGREFVGFDLAGGDKDLGGHTANTRIDAARRGRPLDLGAVKRTERLEAAGQGSLFAGEGA